MVCNQDLINLEVKILVKMNFDYNFSGPIQALERFMRILNYDLNNTVSEMSL